MESWETIELGPHLIGRERECSLIQQLLEDGRAGQSGSLVIRGQAGIGKSSLLQFAAHNVGSATLLRETAVSADSDLPFAGIYGLMRPIMNLLDRLPGTQSAALSAAFGLPSSGEPDRFLVSAAVLSLLAAAGEADPVVCLIDDAQWLDQSSADALVFAARRLHADRVSILFAAREGEARRFAAPGVRELRLDGLDESAARKVVGLRWPKVPASVQARVLEVAAGNPLALLELPAALTAAQVAGEERLPEAIPLTPRLQGVFAERARELPDETQSMLLLCAADNTGDVATILRAAARLNLPAEALDPAEQAGLVRTQGQALAFHHPLVRSAIYEAATLTRRQRAHAALADALAGPEQLDRRVWHQAMAAVTGDESVARSLEESARRAQQRGAHASAATALQRAAELTCDEAQLAPRLAAAAEAAWNAGQLDRARSLVERASRLVDVNVRVRLLHLQGRIEAEEGNARAAAEALLAAADHGQPSLTLEILTDALAPALEAGLPQQLAVDVARQAATLRVDSDRDTFNRSVVLWYGQQFTGQLDEARLTCDEVIRLAYAVDDDPKVQFWAATIATIVLDLGAGLLFANRAVDLARRQGRIGLLPMLLATQARELAWNGQYDQGYAAAGEGYRLALDTGRTPAWHQLNLARVEAIWGRVDDAREHAEQALASGSGNTLVAPMVWAVLGLLELSIGAPGQAVELLSRLTSDQRLHGLAAFAAPDLIEAIVRSNGPPELAEAAFELLRGEGVIPGDWRLAALARCEGLLGNRAPEDAFLEAIELGRRLPPFERGRTELLYGEWLRRERRRTDARNHLRAAAELFHSIGAIRWEQRAQTELRATGETARARAPSSLDELTAQELQISRLAGEGMTNREIAAQLYISRHTVEYHLRKVFVKLGISSRAELVRRNTIVSAPRNGEDFAA